MVMESYYITHEKLPGRKRQKRVGSENDPKEKGAHYRDDYGL